MSRFDDRKKAIINQDNYDDPVQSFLSSKPVQTKKRRGKKDKRPGQQLVYLSNEIKTALALMATYEDKDKSEIAEFALSKYIPEKYKQMAREKLNS
jgi:hypothetical protein